MAKDKTSFILYCDLLKSVDHLTNEELGILFKHILEYVNDLDPVLEDRLLLTAWKPIQRSLKEDLEKWEKIRVKRSEAGKKGGKQKQANLANAKSVKQNLANQAVSVTVTDNVNVTSSSELLQLWVNYRNSINKPITDYSHKQLENRIEREGFAKAKYIVELSIENGWQGLFWNKWDEHNKGQELRPLTKSEARDGLNVPRMMDKLLADGYTKEQIESYAN